MTWIIHRTLLYKNDVNVNLVKLFLLFLTKKNFKTKLRISTCLPNNCCCLHTSTFFITIACVQSYGGNCKFLCAPHCYNQTCDRFNGRCLLGCQDGFYGDLCERGSYFLVLHKYNLIQWQFPLFLTSMWLYSLYYIVYIC